MPPPKVRENLKRAAFLPVLTAAATFGLVSGHTITPASQCRLRRLWRDKANFHEARRSEHAAILPRLQPEHEQWRIDASSRSSVTVLVARPAIGSPWPGRGTECRSAQGSFPKPFRRPREHSRSRVETI